MKLTAPAICLLVALPTTPVAAQVVDGSSDQAYEDSIRAMAESLDETQKERFEKGLVRTILDRYPPAAGAEGFQKLMFLDAAIKAAPRTLDGLGIEDILEAGGGSAADTPRGNSGEPGDSAEIRVEKERSCLREKLVISDIQVEKGSFGHDLSFSVTNGLDWAVAGLGFDYVVETPGRSVPWEKEHSFTSVSGGIEPGETRTITKMTAAIPSAAPDDLTATITIDDAVDAEERQLIREIGVIGWSDEISPLSCLSPG